MYLLELVGDDDAFAIREAASRCSDVERLVPGLGTARGVSRPETLAYTRRVGRLLGTCDPAVTDAVALLSATSFDDVQGSVAVRARDVRGRSGVDTQAAERRLGTVLVDRDFEVDLEAPDHILLALFSDTAALGWQVATSRRDFDSRRPSEKPFFQPGSMDPMDARALANVAGGGPDARLLDPMCGTGGILVEAGLDGADVVGVDVQRKMAAGARENLGHYLAEAGAGDDAVDRPDDRGDFEVVRGDATRLPFPDDSFDSAVFDAPYGRQSKIGGVSLEELVEGAFGEVRRVAARAVVVGDRPWTDAAEAAGWSVESRFDRRVHRSLTRYVHVLR